MPWLTELNIQPNVTCSDTREPLILGRSIVNYRLTRRQRGKVIRHESVFKRSPDIYYVNRILGVSVALAVG